jgi:pyruvate/2-oxoglutarate/acetoin dehydrogenase E1 component
MSNKFCKQAAKELKQGIEIYIANKGSFQSNDMETILESLHQFESTKKITIAVYESFKNGTTTTYNEIIKEWEILLEQDK